MKNDVLLCTIWRKTSKKIFVEKKPVLSEILLINRGVPKKEIAGETKVGYIYSQRGDSGFVLYTSL
jgi:hypothetical protein